MEQTIRYMRFSDCTGNHTRYMQKAVEAYYALEKNPVEDIQNRCVIYTTEGYQRMCQDLMFRQSINKHFHYKIWDKSLPEEHAKALRRYFKTVYFLDLISGKANWY